jgi:hypothetical protein
VNKKVTVPDGKSATPTPLLDNTDSQVNQSNRTSGRSQAARGSVRAVVGLKT